MLKAIYAEAYFIFIISINIMNIAMTSVTWYCGL